MPAPWHWHHPVWSHRSGFISTGVYGAEYEITNVSSRSKSFALIKRHKFNTQRINTHWGTPRQRIEIRIQFYKIVSIPLRLSLESGIGLSWFIDEGRLSSCYRRPYEVWYNLVGRLPPSLGLIRSATASLSSHHGILIFSGQNRCSYLSGLITIPCESMDLSKSESGRVTDQASTGQHIEQNRSLYCIES